MTDLELHSQTSDQAFADLVRKHIGWVYGVARRRLNDVQLAEDVTQGVFLLLHRKNPRFIAEGALVKWLHKAAWYATESTLRNQRRRQARETEAAKMRPVSTEESLSDEWRQIAPVLDELIEKLNRSDREAILLRFYREMTFGQVGVQLNITEEAARKRVERAIDKLRGLASGRGLTFSATALVLELTRHTVLAPPSGVLATTIASGSASSLSPAGSIVAKGALKMMLIAKMKLGLVAALIALSVGGTLLLAARGDKQDKAEKGSVDKYPFLAPYSQVRWRKLVPEVLIDKAWYELIALDDIPAGQIVDFARRTYGDKMWQKRFDEDLVEVLSKMGNPPADKVTLRLLNLETKKEVTLKDVPMTEKNRWAIWTTRNTPTTAGASQPDRLPDEIAKRSPFTDVRFKGNDPQVQVQSKWFDLIAIDDQQVSKIVDFTQLTYGDELWEKRFCEDLVEVLTKIGKPPADQVKLELREPGSEKTITMNNVPLTKENHRAIMLERMKP